MMKFIQSLRKEKYLHNSNGKLFKSLKRENFGIIVLKWFSKKIKSDSKDKLIEYFIKNIHT